MNRGKSIIITLAVMLIPWAASAAGNPWKSELPFENATIRYELSGMESGREVLYIRKFGKETARYRSTTTSMLGLTSSNEKMEISTPDWVYFFDLKEGTGMQSVNPRKIIVEMYHTLLPEEQKKVAENAEKIWVSITNGTQGLIEQNVVDIMGYPCDRTTMMGSTRYTIHGTPITLLSESNMFGISMKSVATAITEDRADDRYFQFPEGIEPHHDKAADRLARMRAEQTIAVLKDPEAYEKKIRNKVGFSPDDEDITEEDRRQFEKAMKTLKGVFGN